MTNRAAGVDVVIVGGGAAGLAAALMLGRARRSVVVVDAGEPRNAPAEHIHGYLGREGMSPAAFLATGRDEVHQYGVEVVAGEAIRAERAADGTFTVALAGGGAVRGRRLLVATGLVDELPDIPGLSARWGHDVVHCPYCHGWEVQDRPIAVIGTNPMGVHQASLFRQLSDTVTLIIHDGPPPAPVEREQLHSRGVSIVDGPVTEVVVGDDRITGVRLATGTVVAVDVVAVAPRLVARAEVLATLGLEPVEAPLGMGMMIEADSTGATSIAGVFVAGNVADVRGQVLHAAAAGSLTGAAINADLIAEDTARAVEASRVWSHDSPPVMDEAFWDERYRAKPKIWSGNPNPHLVTDTADLAPGTALDIGTGEGADAIWLAERGWEVTAADISTVALARGRERAEQLAPDVGARITWVHADLTAWEPPAAAFDLVSAQFMQLPPDQRAPLFERCAAAVAHGGTLLIVGHHPRDMHAGVSRPHWPEMYFTAEEIAATLGSRWIIVAAGTRAREVSGADGTPTTVHDSVLVARHTS